MARKFGMGFSWGYIFVQGFFGVLFEALGIFFFQSSKDMTGVCLALYPDKREKIAPVLHIIFRGQLVA